MTTNPLLAGLRPVHPGEILAEDILPALKAEHGVTKAAFAGHLGMTRVALDNILKGKSAITPATAVRLGKLLDARPEFWLDLQAAYDLRRARDQLASELEQLPVLTAA